MSTVQERDPLRDTIQHPFGLGSRLSHPISGTLSFPRLVTRNDPYGLLNVSPSGQILTRNSQHILKLSPHLCPVPVPRVPCWFRYELLPFYRKTRPHRTHGTTPPSPPTSPFLFTPPPTPRLHLPGNSGPLLRSRRNTSLVLV